VSNSESSLEPYYSDDLVTLYRGDCRDVLPELDPVDLVLTDPPYGINYVSRHNVGRGTNPITNDGARLSVALQRKVIPLLRAQHVLWFTRWDVWPDIWSELGPWFPMRGMLIWDKGHNGMGDLGHWGPSYEMIASAGAGTCTGGRDQSIIRFNAPPASTRVHPTEKPQPLLRYLIGKLNAQTVLDPFAGGGSTLLAAAELGVRAVGVEIDERYCEAIAQRLTDRASAPFLPFDEAAS
jgi:site-specific DNA-methyltransferase (adenine-specific)